MHRIIFYMLIPIAFVWAAPQSLRADSPWDLVTQGNAAYSAGKWDEALSAYDEATVEDPESPYLYFNKGAALYQKGDYKAAAAAFEEAALKSKDISLEARSRFNLGNCAFRESERQKDSDLNKALEACGKSIQHYQEALELVPDFKEAAENIEVVRLVMKTILDEINRQKEEAQAQQEAMQKLAEKIKALIKQQQKALDRNQHLQDEVKRKGDSGPLRRQIQDLAQEQKDIQDETEQLADNLPQACNQGPPGEENATEKHLKNAATEQEAAAGNLDQYHQQEAKANQEKALKELSDALNSLKKDQKNGQQQSQGDQHEQEQQSSPSGKEPQEDKDQKEAQTAQTMSSDDAQDILDEEKDNQQRRQYEAPGGYRDVERDW